MTEQEHNDEPVWPTCEECGISGPDVDQDEYSRALLCDDCEDELYGR